MAETGKTIDELRKLPIAERLQLVEDLWDSIAEESPGFGVPVTPELAQELDRRLAEFEAAPDTTLPWDDVRERIRRLAGERVS